MPSILAALPRRVGAVALCAALAGCSVFGGPAAEEPPFTLVEKDGAIEIRDYAEIVIARTTVAADSRDAAVSEGFGRLFDYITGANEGAREIAMTAPVIVDPDEAATADEGAEIAMTAPVLVEESEESADRAWTTVFVLPEEMTLENAPLPTSADVTLDTVPGRRVAVARFSGFFNGGNADKAQASLEAWLKARQIAHQGDWQSAGYNPPWTLPWLRRNEVLVTLE